MDCRGLRWEGRVFICIVVLVFLAIIATFGYLLIGLPIQNNMELKKARRLPHPQYNLSDASLSPNAFVDDQNRLTADFNFTLKAYNDPNIKNKTIFYDNNSSSAAARVTLYYLVRVSYGKGQHGIVPMEFAPPSPSVMMGPSSLSPLSSAVFTLNLHVQNLKLPYPNIDDDGTTQYYTMTLEVDYGARFEEESKYHKVSVQCYDLNCTFPTGFVTGYGGACTSFPLTS